MTALLASGCSTLLGLDEFTDAAGPGSGGGDTTSCERGDTRACYEGASETEGVGVCAPGTQTCDADGRWGACEKQVLPGKEDCNQRGDEDCDGVGCSDVLWARMFGSGPFQWATSVAISPKGDRIALAGLYRDEINFGPDATTALPEQARGGAFLAVFDGEGRHLYSVGVPAGDSWPVVAIDAESNALFAASYTETVNLGGGDLPVSGRSAMLVAKLDSDGGHVWSTHFGGPDSPEIDPVDVAVAPDGDLVITGFFKGTVSFGGPALEAVNASDADAFLVRLSGDDGGHVYSVRIGDHMVDTPGVQWGKGVGVDAMGRTVVAGTFVNSIDFGSGRTRDAVDMGIFGWVAQYDAEGTLLWDTTFGHDNDGSTVEISGVDVDAAGNVGIVGHFSGSVRFPATSDIRVTRTTTGADDVDLFIVRLSATGAHSWSKQLGDTTDQSWDLPFQGVAFDSEGELVFAGGFHGKVDFGGGELTADDADWFVARFDASGTHRWSHRYGSAAAFQGATSAAIQPDTREIIVAGVSDGTVDLVDPPLTTDTLGVVMMRMSP
ncbi:hypothetical protein [Sorangium sp. So ce233]|uniref:hypothetical protein n=1 Tax=Sorangium sp. So ce233 TaxID=3133290 RepID=UPI003F611842